MHMSHDDHTVELIKFEQAMAPKTKTKCYNAHNVATRVSFSISARQRSLQGGQNLRDSWIVCSSNGGQQEDKRAHNSHQSKFLHNYYTFESVHDSDHDGVVRIFIGLSCELGDFTI